MIPFYMRAALGFNGLNTILPTLNITRLNSVRMRENTDQNNSKYGQFSRSVNVEKWSNKTKQR